MYIKSARLQNYRSYFDSGTLEFSPGFNLVVGKNNAGKTSLLTALSASFIGEPHSSLATCPTTLDRPPRTSRLDMTLALTGNEFKQVLISTGNSDRSFPWPADLPFVDENLAIALENLTRASEIPLRVSASAPVGSGIESWQPTEYPSTSLYAPLVLNNIYPMLTVSINIDQRAVVATSRAKNSNPGQDFGIVVGQTLAQQIYRFDAERLSLSHAETKGSPELASNASNLASVLNIMQGNHHSFRDYCDLVRAVFPQVQAISIRPQPGNPRLSEILVWQIDPATERTDLAMPLMKSGTGIGQVLALLYVVRSSTNARTIIVDEPGSFLHPGAARALIQILKQYPQHQYIVATHSPEIISELADSPVTILSWLDSQTVVKQHPRTTKKSASESLAEVGAKLSDVFGFDRILWTEGASDADTLRVVLQFEGKYSPSLAVVPVRDAGSFHRRSISEVLAIYRKLSMGNALLPPAVLFIFDRDGRSVREMDDAVRESGGKVRFLKRRMIENYVLDPGAIVQVFNDAGLEHGIETSLTEVSDWIESNGSKVEYFPNEEPVAAFSDIWRIRIHAAKLLTDLFIDLSNNTLFFSKTIHTQAIAAEICRTRVEIMEPLISEIRDVLG